MIDERPGFLAFYAAGGLDTFGLEGGGHRWQRVPPNERHGRVHTSTVTVAVMEPREGESGEVAILPADVEIVATRGTGPGGQHRNTTNSCIVVTHKATGIKARVDMRSQHRSKALALQIIAAKLRDLAAGEHADAENASRREQIGSGMRGDKIRTYRTQDDRVTDHRSGKSFRLSDWTQGVWK